MLRIYTPRLKSSLFVMVIAAVTAGCAHIEVRAPADNPIAEAGPVIAAAPEVTVSGDLKWVIPVPAGKIKLDGDLSEWDFSKPAIVANDKAIDVDHMGWKQPPPAGDADLSGVIQVAWDNENLYLAAKITDDDLAENTGQESWDFPWYYDGVCVVIKMPAQITEGPRAIKGAKKQFYIGLDYYSEDVGPRPFGDGTRYLAKRTAYGFDIEAAIPFEALGFRPIAGDRVPFMVILTDSQSLKAPNLATAQIGLPTRGGGENSKNEIAKLRLLTADGWGGELIAEKAVLTPGEKLTYIGTIDVADKAIAMGSVEVVAVSGGKVIARTAEGQTLEVGNRYQIFGEIDLPADIEPGKYNLRLTAGDSTAVVGEFTVAETDAAKAGPKINTTTARFGEDTTRYYEREDDSARFLAQQKVTRRSYVEYFREDSMYDAGQIITSPGRHGIYGVRHAFPALVQYDALKKFEADPTSDLAPDWLKKYTAADIEVALKETLKAYEEALREIVEKKGSHEHFMWEPKLLCMYRKVFMENGDWSDGDEAWFKDFYVWICRTVYVLGKPKTEFRGPHHRPTGEASMKLIAATFYPDIPEAEHWKKYGELQWNDWWEYRDTPINDINYFHNQILHVVIASHLLGREETFTDPQMQKFWSRLIHMNSSEGAVIPVAMAVGWHSQAGVRLMCLEAAGAYNKDGRYRFAAHRIFNYTQYQYNPKTQPWYHRGGVDSSGIAMAYFLADDSVAPVEPAGSVYLDHKDVLVVKHKEGGKHYLKEIDPRPDYNHIDTNLICTNDVVPFKLALRSSWNPGTMYMLVELFPRHAPQNVGGVLSMMKYNSVFTYPIDSKMQTDWHNMFRIDDVGGMAEMLTNPNPYTIDSYYMDVTVPKFFDAKAATYAVMDVENFMGFPMKYRREFFFIKNRFCVIRDTAKFRESFMAKLGPNWNTQNVGRQIGDHWANTYITAPIGSKTKMNHAQADLLVYHAPRGNRKLEIKEEATDIRRLDTPFTLRYVQEGIVKPGREYTFTHLLMPGLPHRMQEWSSDPSASSLKKILGYYMADGVEVVADDNDKSIWKITTPSGSIEWVVFNDTGQTVSAGDIETDAGQVYVNVQDGKTTSVVMFDGTYVTLNGEKIVELPSRGDFEQ